MNRRIVALNLVLAALLVWLGVRLRANWLESQAHEASAVQRSPKPVAVVPPPALPAVPPVSAAQYENVAQKTLFAEDRDPSEIIVVPAPAPPPPPPPPPPPMPALPRYYGQMTFSDPVIVLGTDAASQKRYHKGDKIGDFKLVAFDRDTVTLEWNEKTVNRNLRDLAPKNEAPLRPTAVAEPPSQAPAAAAVARVESKPKTDPAFGVQRGMYRDCVPSDTSPSGTVKDGYRKLIVQVMMGETCQWEPIK